MIALQTLFNAYFWWEDTSRTLFEGKKKTGAKWLKIRWRLKFVFEVTYEIIADFVNTNFSGIKLYWIWKLWKIKISATRKLSLLTKLLTSKKLWALKKSFFGKKKRNIHISVIFYFIDKGPGRFSNFVTNCKESCSKYWRLYKAYTKSIYI